ncbi:hypothetical protein L2E82_05579 [Cichorium intybus]|uniref:Uncharacterized protein n=1 Tax=Cichorium intybus TaxID=13427 RepID=A0ACB9H845_CICIN|nr:hypothetical protein L2E82_05579 [Cichorium intybus]
MGKSELRKQKLNQHQRLWIIRRMRLRSDRRLPALVASSSGFITTASPTVDDVVSGYRRGNDFSEINFSFRKRPLKEQGVVSPVTSGKSIVEDEEFSLAKVSFGVIGLGLGVSFLS